MSKFAFITKELFWNITALAFTVFLYTFFKDYTFWGYKINGLLSIIMALRIVALASFLYNIYKTYKLNINLGNPKNQIGKLHHSFYVNLSKAYIEETFEHNIWNYETYNKKDEGNTLLINANFYSMYKNDLVTLIITPIDDGQSNIAITTGRQQKSSWWRTHQNWNSALFWIETFTNELTKRERINYKPTLA